MGSTTHLAKVMFSLADAGLVLGRKDTLAWYHHEDRFVPWLEHAKPTPLRTHAFAMIASEAYSTT